MDNLLLESLEILNFRAFRHLRIDHLGRINLIAGKNNVGKTCLLEALRLYAYRGSPELIVDILDARDESGYNTPTDSSNLERPLALKYLFHGRKDIIDIPEPIQIGTVNDKSAMLSIGLAWYTFQVNEQSIRELKELELDEYNTVENPTLRLTVQLGEQSKKSYPIDDVRRRLPRGVSQEINCVFIGAGGLEKSQIGIFWDNIAISDFEEDVLTALRIIAPTIERLSIIGEQEVYAGTKRRLERIPIIRTSNNDLPIPLRSLGEGMTRMLGLVLALVNTKNGILLIDEIESGLHYSVQLDMWRLIFQVARRLNVQVFATTHSWDCIESFQKAAAEDEQSEGMLIRLGHKKGDIVATIFNEQELAIATREQIEVR